jgi:hypothetical protein
MEGIHNGGKERKYLKKKKRQKNYRKRDLNDNKYYVGQRLYPTYLIFFLFKFLLYLFS